MKVGIITKIDNNNYGNRLQNFALCYYLKNNFHVKCETIKNISQLNNMHDSRIINFLKRIKNIYLKRLFVKNKKRYKSFLKFNKNIKFSKKVYDNYKTLKPYEYDKVIIGSDQVWNYNFDMPDLYFGKGISFENVISYSASFGVSNIPIEKMEYYKKRLKNVKYISVREETGKSIIQNILNKKNVEVLIDPTMLLSCNEWETVLKKPKMLKANKYILNYFLGDLSNEKKQEIERVANENNCEIINILDKNSPFFECGPSEFLYLEKNAFLICTDSFHSSVFAILFNIPFIIFERDQEGMKNMNSRLENLVFKFKLENRRFDGKITKQNLNHDYSQSYKILDEERKKSKKFLEKALLK